MHRRTISRLFYFHSHPIPRPRLYNILLFVRKTISRRWTSSDKTATAAAVVVHYTSTHGGRPMTTAACAKPTPAADVPAFFANKSLCTRRIFIFRDLLEIPFSPLVHYVVTNNNNNRVRGVQSNAVDFWKYIVFTCIVNFIFVFFIPYPISGNFFSQHYGNPTTAYRCDTIYNLQRFRRY